MTCRFELEYKGEPYPRTCPTCGLSGKCVKGYTQYLYERGGYSIISPDGKPPMKKADIAPAQKTDGEIIANGRDAMAWAKDFIGICPGASALNLQTVFGWFANAIQAQHNRKHIYNNAAQEWLQDIPVMQQSVLFSGIRGMDGLAKRHPAKMLVRFYRRCVLISAFEGATITDPYTPGGGDFTGPSLEALRHRISHEKFLSDKDGYDCPLHEWPRAMQPIVDAFIRARDEMPLHYYSHMMHAFQIVGYHHPNDVIRQFWFNVYMRMVNALHLYPETNTDMDSRLGDTEAGWKAREDAAGSCSS